MSNHTEHMNHRCECADDGPVIVATFGGLVTFDSYESAHHTGAKCFDYVLVQVQKRDRGMADEIADELYDLIDAGDVWGELGWDWLTERGVDAQAVYDDAEARAKAVQPDGAS